MSETSELLKYRGQWGGKIESGEEMWWSEPDARLLDRSAKARFLYWLDVRQHFILGFYREARKKAGRALRAIDFGCGSGGTTLNLAAYLQQEITGYDIFETQLRIGRQFAARKGVSCKFEKLSDSGGIPVADASLDLIFSLDVLGHVPDIPATLKEWHRALKPGGTVALFTESDFSPGDRSIAGRLAARGFDMAKVVPEHISLFPKEELERMFAAAGFRVEERYSANVWHFLFFPKDYLLLLSGKPSAPAGILFLAKVWNRLSKITPFYPWPFQALRLVVTQLFGRKALGSSYFYRLTRI